MIKLRLSLLAMFLFCCAATLHGQEPTLFPVRVGELAGYINKDGKMVIAPQFDGADLFVDGIAMVRSTNQLFGFINESGTYVINPQYAMAVPFHEGFAAVTRANGSCQYIDTKGEVKITLDSAENAGAFNEGMAVFYQNGKAGYVNTGGQVIIRPQYESASPFSEGLAAVSVTDKQGREQFGFINNKGTLVIGHQFEMVDMFVDSLCVVFDGHRYGYINRNGKYVVNPLFTKAGTFANGMAKVEQNGRYGFINKTGKIVIKPQFNFVSDFTANGLALVDIGTDDKPMHGYINKTGIMVIKPIFHAATDFSGPIAFAGNSYENMGIIDKSGVFKVKPRFNIAEPAYSPSWLFRRMKSKFTVTDKDSPWRTAGIWLNGFYHFEYDNASAVSTNETKEVIDQFAIVTSMLDEAKANEIRNVTIRIRNVAQTESSAEVFYTLSDRPTALRLLRLVKVNHTWLADFKLEDMNAEVVPSER